MKKIIILLFLLITCSYSSHSQKYISSKGTLERLIKKALKAGNSNSYSVGYLDCDHAQMPAADIELFFKVNSDKYYLVNYEECPASYYFDYAHRKMLHFQFMIKEPTNLPEDQKKIIVQKINKANAPPKQVKRSGYYLQMDAFIAYLISKSPPLEKHYIPGGKLPLYSYIYQPTFRGSRKFNPKLKESKFSQYMNDNNYYYEVIVARKEYEGGENLILTFNFRKKDEVDNYSVEKATYEKEEKTRQQEQAKLQAENERKATLAAAQQKYEQEVQAARGRAGSKRGWSVLEDHEGYYIGETRHGKREGYGEYYYKHLAPIEDTYEAKISYTGNWANDQYSGQGEYKYYFKTRTDGLWTAYYGHYCAIKANFVNGKAEGDGYYSEQRTGFLAGHSTYDHVLYQNGGIYRNYSEEERQSSRNEIQNSDCFSLIEKIKVNYTDGTNKTAVGYKIRCVPPSKYSFERVLYYNTGGNRYQKGWTFDDGGVALKDSYLGFKDDTFEQAAKKSCGCY